VEQVKFNKLTPGSPEWLAARINSIGASEMAAVLGKDPYKTPYQLWLEKTKRKPGFEGNAATERGTEMEPKIRAQYEIELGFVDLPEKCVVHPEHSFLTATLDGLSEDNKIILEIKYPSEKSHLMAVNGEVPNHYWIQCQHQLMCVPEAEINHYVSHRDEQNAVVKVEPDLEFQAKMLKAAIAFWELVKSDVPPPLTDKDDKWTDEESVKARCESLICLKGKKDNTSKLKTEQLKAEIIESMGHPRVRCGRVLITTSQKKDGSPSYRMTIGKAA